MQKMKFTLIMACIIAVFGCKKEIPLSEQNMQQTAAVTDSLPTTSKDKELVENLGKLTEVLKELYIDNSNLKIVNASIFAHAYTDESILVRDLIYPEQSRLNGNASFKNYMQKWSLSLEYFAGNFWKEVSKTNDENFKRFLTELGGIGLSNASGKGQPAAGRVSNYSDEVTVYFPYSEERRPNPEGTYAPITSIVAATADADQGIGYQPYFENRMFQFYNVVMIDDEYAFNNPTQIVGVNGIEPYYATVATNSAFPPGTP